MTSLLASWSLDPDRVRLGDAASAACGLRFDLEERHWITLVGFGTWWVLPFARTVDDELFGVRVSPGAPIAESPIVMAKEFEVATIASRPAAFVPTCLARTAIATDSSWDGVRSLSRESWSELLELHHLLGGAGDFARLRAMLEDRGLQSSVSACDPVATARLLCAGDDAPESGTYHEYVARAVASYEAPVPIPDVGCWSAAAAAISFVTNSMKKWKGARDSDALQAAWLVANQPASLDSFQSSIPSQFSPPFGASPKRLALQHAVFLAEREQQVSPAWRQDPLWPAICQLGRHPGEYGGTAHMKAAENLAAAGQPERAYVALATAAYWMWVFTQKPFPTLMEGALLLAKESGWAEVHDALLAIAEKVAEYGPAK